MSLKKFCASLVFAAFIISGLVAVFVCSGCQLDVSGAVGTKVFYPDKEKGDPRKGMYDGSGYTESSDGHSDFKGFSGMKGGK